MPTTWDDLRLKFPYLNPYVGLPPTRELFAYMSVTGWHFWGTATHYFV
jgi:hypothetical protein